MLCRQTSATGEAFFWVVFFVIKDKTSHMVLEVIKSHVKHRGVGYATKSSCRPAKLRLILTEIGITLCNRFEEPKPSLFSF